MKKVEEPLDKLDDIETSFKKLGKEFFKYLDDMPEGGFIIQQGIIKYANQSLAKLIKYAAEELIGTPFIDYIHTDDIHRVVDQLKKCVVGENIEKMYKICFLKRDGKKIIVDVKTRKIRFKEEPAVIGAIKPSTQKD